MKTHSCLLFLVLIVSGCATPPKPAASTATIDSPPVIALMAAYEPEIDALLAQLKQAAHAEMTSTVQIKGIVFHEGTYRGRHVIAFATGMSIANAAMSTQIALDHFNVQAVLFAGIAGGVNDRWHTADVVVPERWSYHDESAYFNADGHGGYVVSPYFEHSAFFARDRSDPNEPDYTNFGMMFPDEVTVMKEGWDKPKRVGYFTVDHDLFAAAQSAVAQLPPIAVSRTRSAQVSVGGNGVSGSVFLDSADYRRWVRAVWHAEVTEMEGAAIGQVATINQVPWIIVRSVSDLAGGQKGKNEEEIYDRIASKNAVTVLLATLDKWLETRSK